MSSTYSKVCASANFTETDFLFGLGIHVSSRFCLQRIRDVFGSILNVCGNGNSTFCAQVVDKIPTIEWKVIFKICQILYHFEFEANLSEFDNKEEIFLFPVLAAFSFCLIARWLLSTHLQVIRFS